MMSPTWWGASLLDELIDSCLLTLALDPLQPKCDDDVRSNHFLWIGSNPAP